MTDAITIVTPPATPTPEAPPSPPSEVAAVVETITAVADGQVALANLQAAGAQIEAQVATEAAAETIEQAVETIEQITEGENDQWRAITSLREQVDRIPELVAEAVAAALSTPQPSSETLEQPETASTPQSMSDETAETPMEAFVESVAESPVVEVQLNRPRRVAI